MSRVSAGNFPDLEEPDQKSFGLDYFRSAEDSVYGSTTYLLESKVDPDRRPDAFAAIFGDGPAQTGQVEILLSEGEKSMHVNDIWEIIEDVERLEVPESDTPGRFGNITYFPGNKSDQLSAELLGHPDLPLVDQIYRISAGSEQQTLDDHISHAVKEAYKDVLSH